MTLEEMTFIFNGFDYPCRPHDGIPPKIKGSVERFKDPDTINFSPVPHEPYDNQVYDWIQA